MSHIRFTSKIDRAYYKLDRDNKLLNQNFKCYYCQAKLTFSTVTADHLIPLTKTNRRHIANNIVAACAKCNRKKGSKKSFKISPFELLIIEACKRLEEQGFKAAYNIRVVGGLNTYGSYNKWRTYLKKNIVSSL